MYATSVMIPIGGLGCGDARIAERALARTVGVVQVYVNPITERAYLDYDPAVTSPSELAAVVRRAGFRAGEPVLR